MAAFSVRDLSASLCVSFQFFYDWKKWEEKRKKYGNLFKSLFIFHLAL